MHYKVRASMILDLANVAGFGRIWPDTIGGRILA